MPIFFFPFIWFFPLFSTLNVFLHSLLFPCFPFYLWDMSLNFMLILTQYYLKSYFFLPACARKVSNIDKDDLFMDTHYCPFVFYSTKNKQFGSKTFIFHEKSGMMTTELVGLYQYKLCWRIIQISHLFWVKQCHWR